MLRINDKELKEFIKDFQDSLHYHWSENVLNQSYGYEIIQDIPPHSMIHDWNKDIYFLFDVDDIYQPNIGYYIKKQILMDGFEEWLDQSDKSTDDLVNLLYIIKHTEQKIDEEWGDDIFERILVKYIDWTRKRMNNGAIFAVPLTIKIEWHDKYYKNKNK